MTLTFAPPMSVTLERINAAHKYEQEADMDKVQITITTDKPVKIRVTPNEESCAGAKEAESIKRLIRYVEEEDCDVVRQRETRSNSKG